MTVTQTPSCIKFLNYKKRTNSHIAHAPHLYTHKSNKLSHIFSHCHFLNAYIIVTIKTQNILLIKKLQSVYNEVGIRIGLRLHCLKLKYF